MAERVRVRDLDADEGQRLLRTTRRGSGSMVTWRRAQMVLLSAQGMPVVGMPRWRSPAKAAYGMAPGDLWQRANGSR